ncbi:MAG: N-acetylmuramoyl-L-alanine amidase [Akkermansiaceae bacterium]
MKLGQLALHLASLLMLIVIGPISAETYTVRPSDTLYSIAKRHGVGVSTLQRVNDIKDVTKLQIGQKLSIPSVRLATKSSKWVPKKKSLRVVLDAGHGGKDKGAYWHGVCESDLNLRVARRVEASLKARAYSVVMTRRSDIFLSLSKRAQIGNRYRNSIFVSIHFNASSNTSIHGAETFYGGGKQGHYLAKAIQSELVSRLKLRNRGARLGRYTVLQKTRCPAVLVECGFISNTRERNRCKTSSYQASCASAIVAGIERYDRVY